MQSPRSFHLCVERGGGTHLFCLQTNSFDLTVLRMKVGWTIFFYYYYFYFQFVRLLYLVPLMETKLGVERIYSGGKKKKNEDAFHHPANQKQRYGFLFFLCYPTPPGNI